MATSAKSRIDLHETLQRHVFSHAVICTYTFNPLFFEEYCLDKFDSLKRNGNISVILDRGTYQRAIQAGEHHRPRQANLRYLLHPTAPRGVFHAKLVLLAGPKRGRLVIGSANFTRPGITSNAELVAAFELEPGKDESAAPLFGQALAFLERLAERWPSESLESNLAALRRDADWLVLVKAPTEEVALLDNLSRPLLEQLAERVVPPVSRLSLVSRFFDETPALLTKVTALLDPAEVCIYTQNGTTTMTPAWIDACNQLGREAAIYLCPYGDGENPQDLHAKALLVEDAAGALLAYGSANFTSAALNRTAETGNVELLLSVRQPSAQPSAESLFAPLGGRKKLVDPNDLRRRAEEDDDQREPPADLDLREAILTGDVLRLSAELPVDVSKPTAELRFPDDASVSYAVHRSTGSLRTAAISNADLRRLGEATVLVRLRAGGLTSDFILVTILQDVRSGGSTRRARHLREAQESARRYLLIHHELGELGDRDALVQFYDLCNIEVTNAPLPPVLRGGRGPVDLMTGMRSLGERNLPLSRSLHEAAMGFVERHLRRLERHVTHGELAGASNFVHIFLATVDVARMQVGRISDGLRGLTAPIEADHWSHVRGHINAYYGALESLANCLVRYVAFLLGRYPRAEVLEHLDADSQEQMREQVQVLLAARKTIEQTRTGRLRFRVGTQTRLGPEWFECVMAVANWRPYEEGVRQQLRCLEAAALGSQ